MLQDGDGTIDFEEYKTIVQLKPKGTASDGAGAPAAKPAGGGYKLELYGGAISLDLNTKS